MHALGQKPLRPWPVLLAALLLLPGGCGFYETGETVAEEQERAFQRGKQLLREGRREDALRAFLRVIERRAGDAPESHFEAGDLYLNHFEEPVEAIYHFRRYLDQKPNSPQAELVRGQINLAMKEFARTFPAEPLQYTMERLDLTATIEDLREENRRLRRELADLREERESLRTDLLEARQRAEAASRRSPEPREPVARQSPSSRTPETSPSRDEESSAGTRTRSYTVEPGDTLYRISTRVYGTGTRWEEIFEANRDVLADPNSVRAGMTLEIPLD